MPTAKEYDPIRSFKFEVNIGSSSTIGFQKVTGLKTGSDVVEYREGNMPIHKRKLPGLTTYDPITLQRGVSTNVDIVNWRAQVAMYEDQNPQHDGVPSGQFSRTVTINVFDKGDKNAGTGPRMWKVFKAWPSELSHGDLNAEASEILIENLVLQHEGLQFFAGGSPVASASSGVPSISDSSGGGIIT